jgi:integrase
MNRVAEFVQAAQRQSTRRSYASAIAHFEIEYKGLLPASSEVVAHYLATQAGTLSNNTLRQRLAALSRWHTDHGFTDPTKDPIIGQVLRGIRAVHPAPEKRARPFEIEHLQLVDAWLANAITQAKVQNNRTMELQHTRNRALVLLGFWRGFRSDELIRLKVQNVTLIPGVGLTCYLDRSKTDRNFDGREFKCPALSRLCPVAALQAWKDISGLEAGAVFRSIDRWGNIDDGALSANSLIPLLRGLFQNAGLSSARAFSSHSLRRGFAGWARESGWDLKDLMEYVGWRDIKSAMRYLETSHAGMQDRFEAALRAIPPSTERRVADTEVASAPSLVAISPPVVPAAIAVPLALLRVTLSVSLFAKGVGSTKRCLHLIEKTCLARHTMLRLNDPGIAYELRIPCPTRQSLDDTVYAMLDEMVQIAEANQCLLEVSVTEPASGSHWN